MRPIVLFLNIAPPHVALGFLALYIVIIEFLVSKKLVDLTLNILWADEYTGRNGLWISKKVVLFSRDSNISMFKAFSHPERCEVDKYCCVKRMFRRVISEGIEGNCLRVLSLCILGYSGLEKV